MLLATSFTADISVLVQVFGGYLVDVDALFIGFVELGQ